MRIVALVALALFLGGCKSQKLLDTEAEIAGAKTRLAGLQARRADLDAKRKELLASKSTLSQQADLADLERRRLFAAMLALQGSPVPDGILLDEAMRAKDPKLDALAAQIVQRQLPCESGEPGADEPQQGFEGYEACAPPPLDDACEGVEQRTTQSFTWRCTDFIAGPAAAVPTSVVCTADATWEAQLVPPLAAGTNGQGLVSTQLVRIAFERNGHVFVRDWPAPSVDLYRPPNTEPLATCAAENSHAQCIRACEERYGRLGCDGYGDYDEHDHEGDEENPEPPELIAARRAAEDAEAQAAAARDELAYQECLAPCNVDDEAADPPLPADVTLTFESAPAVGVYVFSAVLDLHQETDGGVAEAAPRSIVLENPDLEEAAAGSLEPGEDTVGALTELLDVDYLQVGEPSGGFVTLAGLDGTTVRAVKVAVDGKMSPVVLSPGEACTFINARKTAPKVLVEPCAVPPTPPAPTPAPKQEDTAAPVPKQEGTP